MVVCGRNQTQIPWIPRTNEKHNQISLFFFDVRDSFGFPYQNLFGAKDDTTCLGVKCCMVLVSYSTIKNIHGWNRQIFLFLRKQLLSAVSHLVTWKITTRRQLGVIRMLWGHSQMSAACPDVASAFLNVKTLKKDIITLMEGVTNDVVLLVSSLPASSAGVKETHD